LQNVIIHENFKKSSSDPIISKLVSPESLTSLTFATSLEYYFKQLNSSSDSSSNKDKTSSLPLILNIVSGLRTIIHLITTSIHSQRFQLVQLYECRKVIYILENQFKVLIDQNNSSVKDENTQNKSESEALKTSVNFMRVLFNRFLLLSFFSYYHKDYVPVYEKMLQNPLPEFFRYRNNLFCDDFFFFFFFLK
jgi:hypothetical protein